MNKPSKVHNLIEELRMLKQNITQSYLLLGDRLGTIKDEQLYKAWGYETFEEFIKDPEINFRRSTAYNLVAIVERFREHIMSNKLDIGYTRVVRLLPLPDNEAKTLLSKSPYLTASDFNDELREMRGLMTTYDCEHKDTEVIRKCRDCGKWIKELINQP